MVRKIDQKRSSKWCHKAIKIEVLGVQGVIFEILLDFGKLFFLMFLVLAKGGPKNFKIIILAKGRAQERLIDNPGGPLILADYSQTLHSYI